MFVPSEAIHIYFVQMSPPSDIWRIFPQGFIVCFKAMKHINSHSTTINFKLVNAGVQVSLPTGSKTYPQGANLTVSAAIQSYQSVLLPLFCSRLC